MLQLATVAERPKPHILLIQAGLLTAVPFVLLIGPVGGYYVGNAIDSRISSGPWGMILGIVAGFISSAKLTIQLIQQAREAGSRRNE